MNEAAGPVPSGPSSKVRQISSLGAVRTAGSSPVCLSPAVRIGFLWIKKSLPSGLGKKSVEARLCLGGERWRWVRSACDRCSPKPTAGTGCIQAPCAGAGAAPPRCSFLKPESGRSSARKPEENAALLHRAATARSAGSAGRCVVNT